MSGAASESTPIPFGSLDSGISGHSCKKLLSGYPTVADFIAQDCDATIFRKFQRLGVRNLLYLQSKLSILEARLAQYDEDDFITAPYQNGIRHAARSLAAFEKRATVQESRDGERMKLKDEIKVALKEYREAMMLEKQALDLAQPSRRALMVMRRWFGTGTKGTKLGGADNKLFDDKRDLVALTPVDSDRLDRFLQMSCGWFLRDKTRVDRPHEDIYYFDEGRLRAAGVIVSTLFSVILLIGAIVCLSVLAKSSWRLKLGMIVLFTLLFASVMGLLTNARRAEIFVGTAGYAAVLVVFAK